MSLLRAYGHPNPEDYPLWLLSMEADIVAERIDVEAVTAAVLMRGAVASLLSKEAAEHWQQTVKELAGGYDAE